MNRISSIILPAVVVIGSFVPATAYADLVYEGSCDDLQAREGFSIIDDYRGNVVHLGNQHDGYVEQYTFYACSFPGNSDCDDSWDLGMYQYNATKKNACTHDQPSNGSYGSGGGGYAPPGGGGGGGSSGPSPPSGCYGNCGPLFGEVGEFKQIEDEVKPE